MPSEDVTALLGEWEGYRVGFVERHESKKEGSVPQVWIELGAVRPRLTSVLPDSRRRVQIRVYESGVPPRFSKGPAPTSGGLVAMSF